MSVCPVRLTWLGFNSFNFGSDTFTITGTFPTGLDNAKIAGFAPGYSGITYGDIEAGDGILVFLATMERTSCDGDPVAVTSVTDSAGNTYVHLPDFDYGTGVGGSDESMSLEAWWCESSVAAIPASAVNWPAATSWIVGEWDQPTTIRSIWAFGIRGHLIPDTFVGIVTAGDTDATIRTGLDISVPDQTWTFTNPGGLVLSQGMYPETASLFHDAGGYGPVGDTFQELNAFVSTDSGYGDDACPGDTFGFNANAVVRLASTTTGGGFSAFAIGEEEAGTTDPDDPGIVWTSGTGGAPAGLYKLLIAFGIEAKRCPFRPQIYRRH